MAFEFKSNSPDFVIAGSMKAGTSALQFNLNKHPQIYCLSQYWKNKVLENYSLSTSDYNRGLANKNTKELDFFNSPVNFAHGKDFYEKFFVMNKRAIGESSPNYSQPSDVEDTVANMKSMYPNMKIIITLRDPIDRAFSHWNMVQLKPEASWGDNIRDIDFNTIVENSPNRGLFKRGLYTTYINAYVAAFGKDNVHVVIQEELKANQVTELAKIHDFLEVDSLNGVNPGYRDIFVADYGSRVLDEDSKQMLKLYYADSVEELQNAYPDLDYSKWNSY